MTQVEKWDVFELALQGRQERNPFTDYEIHGIFYHKKETLTVNGFYDGTASTESGSCPPMKVNILMKFPAALVRKPSLGDSRPYRPQKITTALCGLRIGSILSIRTAHRITPAAPHAMHLPFRKPRSSSRLFRNWKRDISIKCGFASCQNITISACRTRRSFLMRGFPWTPVS